MKTLSRSAVAAVAVALCLTGCTTMKRAAVTAGGTAIGAGAGYAIAPSGAKSKAIGTAVGAVAGGIGTALTQGRNQEDYQAGVDDGYSQASSDDVKRLYWARQALVNMADGQKGAVRYYVFEDEGTTQDGRKLAPEKVAIPVYEPSRE